MTKPQEFISTQNSRAEPEEIKEDSKKRLKREY
jgi:hypothetical protein